MSPMHCIWFVCLLHLSNVFLTACLQDRSDYVGSKIKGMCNFVRVVDIYIPTGNGQGWPFPLETYQQTILSDFWIFANLIDEKWYLTVLFISLN